MPVICRFLGIIISMYYKDHPPPHFHAKYGEFNGIFDISTLEMIEGDLPKRIIAYVLEWANLHREELKDNWKLLEEEKKLNKIEPLV